MSAAAFALMAPVSRRPFDDPFRSYLLLVAQLQEEQEQWATTLQWSPSSRRHHFLRERRCSRRHFLFELPSRRRCCSFSNGNSIQAFLELRCGRIKVNNNLSVHHQLDKSFEQALQLLLLVSLHSVAHFHGSLAPLIDNSISRHICSNYLLCDQFTTIRCINEELLFLQPSQRHSVGPTLV